MFRLVETSGYMESPTCFCLFKKLPALLSCPLYNISFISPVYSPSVAVAALPYDSHGRCFCVCKCARFSIYVSAECVLSWVLDTQNDQEERCFVSETAAEPRSHDTSTTVCIQQYNSSTTAPVLQALAFMPVTVYVCGWCTAAGGDRATTARFSPPMQQQ